MDATTVSQWTELDETEAKFLQLLETDRNSVEFARLFTEVDEALSRLLQLERADGAGGAGVP